MSFKKYSKARQEFINNQSDKLDKEIEKSQNKLYKLINQVFLATLPVDKDGNLTPDINFKSLVSKFDRFYDDFLTDEVKPIMDGFTSNIDKLLNHNKKYFDSIEKSDLHKDIKESVLGSLGISGSVVLGGSLLYSILSDRGIISTLKSIVMGSVGAGVTSTALRIAVEEVVVKRDGGILKGLFNEVLPDPYVKIDRFIGQKYSTALQLNYAIYQGGVIATSREFCIERNNKVFSREEIMKFGTPADKFGGYTNKALGEFQGKWDNYNPLTDMGGFNCRHQFDWVSDELAFHLRPELSKLN